MYATYLDESCDSGNSGFYVVAAVVGTGWNVLEGEKLWRALLKKHNLSIFKASHLRHRPEVCLEFASAIRDSGLIACGIIAGQSAVKEHLNGSAFAKQYKESPYMLLYHQTFVNIAMDFREHGATESISFVCDENARYLGIMQRSYPELRRLNPTSDLHMGSCSMADDATCIPLQMADLIASELRKKSPDWQIGDTDFSPPLDLLLQSETIWSVRRYDNRTLSLVRQLVDARHSK